MHHVSSLQKHFIESDQSSRYPLLGFCYARTAGPVAVLVQKVGLVALFTLKGLSKTLAASIWSIGAAPLNGARYLIGKKGLASPFSFKNGFSHFNEAGLTTLHLPFIVFCHIFTPQVILSRQNKHNSSAKATKPQTPFTKGASSLSQLETPTLSQLPPVSDKQISPPSSPTLDDQTLPPPPILEVPVEEELEVPVEEELEVPVEEELEVPVEEELEVPVEEELEVPVEEELEVPVEEELEVLVEEELEVLVEEKLEVPVEEELEVPVEEEDFSSSSPQTPIPHGPLSANQTTAKLLQKANLEQFKEKIQVIKEFFPEDSTLAFLQRKEEQLHNLINHIESWCDNPQAVGKEAIEKVIQEAEIPMAFCQSTLGKTGNSQTVEDFRDLLKERIELLEQEMNRKKLEEPEEQDHPIFTPSSEGYAADSTYGEGNAGALYGESNDYPSTEEIAKRNAQIAKQTEKEQKPPEGGVSNLKSRFEQA